MKQKHSLLSLNQQKFLELFSKNKKMSRRFYLSGGTALTAFYIPYRLSEDLDFFSEKEVDLPAISVFFKSIKPELGWQKLEINTSFNRNILQLIFPKEQLKLEFTYFPFPPIVQPKIKEGVPVDSLLDIAVNKIFTIYQNPRARDFIDLYMILKKKKYSLKGLVKKAKIKFDWHIDPIKLGSQLLLAKELKDYPKLVKPLPKTQWQNYFLKQAKALEKVIIKAS